MCSPALLKSSVQRDRSLQQLVPTRTFSNSEGFLQCRIGQTSLKVGRASVVLSLEIHLGEDLHSLPARRLQCTSEPLLLIATLHWQAALGCACPRWSWAVRGVQTRECNS